MRRNLNNLDRDILQAHGRIFQEAFAHGIENDMIYGGLVSGQSAMQALHANPVAVQNCIIGTRRVTWDGKVFRYSSAMANVGSDYLAWSAHRRQALNWSAVVSGALGANSCVVTFGGSDGDGSGNVALDYLKGGQIVFLNTLLGALTLGITGNTVLTGGGGGACTITLDEALPFLLTNTMKVEAMGNMYAELTAAANCPGDASMVGVASRQATALLPYHWQQTWGPVHVSPNNGFQTENVGNNDYNNQVVVWNGTIGTHEYDDARTEYQQHIGFVISRGQAGTTQDAPFIMLQINK